MGLTDIYKVGYAYVANLLFFVGTWEHINRTVSQMYTELVSYFSVPCLCIKL